MSMLRPSLNQLMTKNESCYSVVVGIAKRAREIADELYDQKKELKEKPVQTETSPNPRFPTAESIASSKARN